MQDKDTTDAELRREVKSLRQRVAELERAEAERQQSERSLQESENKYRLLVESAGDAIFLCEVTGQGLRFVDCNTRALSMFGAKRDEILGRGPLDFSPSVQLGGRPSAEVAAEMIRDVVEGNARSFEWRHCRTDGTIFDAEIALDRLHWDGRPHVMGIVRDISDRKLAERALRFAEFTVDHALDAVFWIEPDARFCYVNQTACQTLGYSRDELLSMTVHDIDPEFPPETWARYWQALRGRGAMTIESRHRAKDGREYPVEISIRRLEFEGLEYNIAFARDISKRKRAEEELLMKNIVFESSIAANSTADRHGIIQLVNPAFLEMWGYDRAEEVVGNPISGFFANADDATPVVEALNSTGRWHGTFVAKRKDGSMFISEGLATIVRNEKGELIGYQSANLDVTDRVRAEREVRELNLALERRVKQRTAELRSVNQELEAFAYTVSHDLRAPLRAMEGFADALLEDCADRLDQNGRDYCRYIVDSASRMDALINDLLDYSRLGRTELRLRSVHLDRVVKEAIERLESEIERRQAQVAVDGALPDITTHPSMMIQVVTNLISNAIKFVESNARPEVRIWAEARENAMRLWVQDNGIGIEPQYQEQIFRVFNRLHGIESYPGTGIGLAIVSRAVERLGGRYGVESSPGTGSRFWVEFDSEEEGDGCPTGNAADRRR